jgi:uncharacterized protein
MSDDPAFLGTGWHFPPTFSDGGEEVLTVTAEDDIRQSLEILLATAQGERIMQEEFGCDLNSVLFEEIDQSLLNKLTQLISDAILYYEPRIMLEDLNVTESPEIDGLLLISIEYVVASTNSRYNLVYPFYLNEAAT